ncbi:c-type cytochrome [Pedobacter flavus]|uniref:Cytochrome c n=1 Tax=Pedobacter flavus TaxID=3113906 RepID=A0ABU7GZB5_9SPHI|nr:cytochrome c [Pedobacter sp. VNH31]MEE1884162.1 cytochrome c [Pedobacter sp. VNH31]
MKGSISAMNRNKIIYGCFFSVVIAVAVAACGKRSTGMEFARNMYDPIGYNPDQPNKGFKNGLTSQVPPSNTTPVGFQEVDTFPNTNEGAVMAGVQLVNPLLPEEKVLLEGKKLFNVFCSPCHGELGDGQGHLVKLEKVSGVPAYFGDAASSRGGLVKDIPAGKIYHTIKHGLNTMGSFASQLTPTERWKVVTYVQQLQKTQ